MNKGIGWYGGPVPVPLAEDLLPHYWDSSRNIKGRAMVGCDDVVILPRVPRPQYLIVAVVPVDSDAEVQREVVLGNAQNIYMSLNNLYVAASELQYHWRGPISGTSTQRTTVYRFKLSDDGIVPKAHGSVPGTILNQFSMDEYEGHFRIATTIGQVWNQQKPSTNNLYILDADLDIVGKIEDIAPGERIYSTRFLGDRTYMVTFKKVDPFFAIDTSDPRNPRILGQLKIPGYSDYLHPYDENHIIGFGKDATESKSGDFAWYQGMKMAMFDVRDPQNPTQLHTFSIGDRGTDSPLLRNHKALLFDKERGLLAFPVQVNTLTDEQKQLPEGNAWGQATFQGAYVFDVSLRRGFTLRGTITHFNDEDMMKMGGYFYGKNIERIVRIGDSLLTLSQDEVQSHTEDTVLKEGGIVFSEEEKAVCPDSADDGVFYASEDLSICVRAIFFCQDNQKLFNDKCGCGCVAE